MSSQGGKRGRLSALFNGDLKSTPQPMIYDLTWRGYWKRGVSLAASSG